jgi:glycosyltransferase involved in cell wall biosynthesis
MKLLIITQKVDINDDNLSFFHRWIEKFSGRLEEVYVICLSVGEYDLPPNVHVFSMGKERGVPKIGQLFLLQKYLIGILPRVDGVFVHMCSIYAICSYILAKIFRKKMILWFAHKNLGWKLRLAERLVDKILTASRESCRLKRRKKIKIVGHGIDVNRFKPADSTNKKDNFVILSAGRINPSKDLETLVEAVDILIGTGNINNLRIMIAGNPITAAEDAYLKKIKDTINEKGLSDNFEFLGSVPNHKMPEYYQASDVFVNLSHTGSMDKVVLEAMACGIPVLTCNESFDSLLDEKYRFEKKNYKELADKIFRIKNNGFKDDLRKIIVDDYNLDNLMDKIINEFKV